jgi:hypothetical protein
MRLRNLEEMVGRLLRRESHSSEASQTAVREAVKSDWIPELVPGRPNQSSAKWVDKIDQLASQQMGRKHHDSTHAESSNGSCSFWYDNLTTYTYTW